LLPCRLFRLSIVLDIRLPLRWRLLRTQPERVGVCPGVVGGVGGGVAEGERVAPGAERVALGEAARVRVEVARAGGRIIDMSA